MLEQPLIGVGLVAAERDLLVTGLREWGGPARCTPELAVGMGFKDLEDFETSLDRLANCLIRDEPLLREDWTRVVLATEIAFVSDILGAGCDWETTTGFSDELSISLLRQIQRKVASSLAR